MALLTGLEHQLQHRAVAGVLGEVFVQHDLAVAIGIQQHRGQGVGNQ